MRRAWALALALPLAAPSAFAALVTIEPPPGWEDVTASKKGPDVVVALKGPETSSFVLAKVTAVSVENRGAVRAFLIDVLASVNQKTGLGFTLASNLNSRTFDNGLTLHSINADYQGKPRLVLGLVEVGDEPMLATLISAVPETLLPSIMGSLKGGSATASARPATSDGQLAFELTDGINARPLSEPERKMGFVLALQGLHSELMIMKLVDDRTPVAEQPGIVSDTVLSMAGVDKASVSRLAALDTPAGPQIVYSSAKLADSGQFAAGYLPWCYWGYSVIAKGPQAAELLQKSFAGLKLGESAQAKLVSETPRVPLGSGIAFKGVKIPPPLLVGGAAAVLLVLVFLLRKK
jgi:hypothetical protein